MRPPGSATWLGAAGLAPATVMCIVAWGGPPNWRFPALEVHAAYAALILSFIGGTWWGLGARLEQPGLVLVLSVVPALAAWATLMLLPSAAALALLSALFFAVLAGDRGLTTRGVAPPWWLALRTPLSFGMGLLALIASYAAG